ncbi:MAG TPA: hypothetical protein PKV92_09290 [Thermodesulfovibrio thiophilus]|nr:hypothetical protein [Thermodesulfovibrio thiophilus]HQD37273.1 hypothetical protein [Thermodesulfovibrio thiophilus]
MKNFKIMQTKNVNISNEVWDSGINIVEPVIVIHPAISTILKVCQKHAGNNEFSILFKGLWTNECFYVSDTYYIPKQKVSTTSVDYEEDIGAVRREQGYNVVVHSHPFAHSSQFSSADNEHINSHFDCSLLYTPSGIADNVLLIPINENLKVRIKASDILTEIINIEVNGLENIKENITPEANFNAM